MWDLGANGRETSTNGVVGTAAVFAASGALQASWLSRLPELVDRLDLRPAGVGVAIAAVGLGWALAMPPTAGLCRSYGMKRVIVVAAFLACLSVIPLGAAHTPMALYIGLFGFGIFSGVCDAGMNVHGYTVERRENKPFMPMFHGCWSVGAGLGALGGALAEHRGYTVGLHVGAAAIACAIIFVGAGPHLLAEPPDEREAAVGQRPASHLLKISVLLACAAIVEGTAPDWLPTLFREEFKAPHSMGPSVYAVFATSMAISRFSAVPIQMRRGRKWMVRVGALVAAVGALIVLGRAGPFAYVGAVLWGLGVGPIFPAAISASGEARQSARAIAITTLVGYLASLVGPIMIGVVANGVGIGVVLLIVPVLAIVIAALASEVDPPVAQSAHRQPGRG